MYALDRESGTHGPWYCQHAPTNFGEYHPYRFRRNTVGVVSGIDIGCAGRLENIDLKRGAMGHGNDRITRSTLLCESLST